MVNYGKGQQLHPFKAIGTGVKAIQKHRELKYKRDMLNHKIQTDTFNNAYKQDKLKHSQNTLEFNKQKHNDLLKDRQEQRNSNERVGKLNYKRGIYQAATKVVTSNNKVLGEKIRAGKDIRGRRTSLKDYLNDNGFYDN